MKLKKLFTVFVMTIALVAVACQTLPVGYEELRTEASLVEVSKYIGSLRDQYILARQRGLLTPEQFIKAVKADESLTAVWNQLIAAFEVQADTYALWAQVIQATTTLENLLVAWIPGYVPADKPTMLGK